MIDDVCTDANAIRARTFVRVLLNRNKLQNVIARVIRNRLILAIIFKYVHNSQLVNAMLTRKIYIFVRNKCWIFQLFAFLLAENCKLCDVRCAHCVLSKHHIDLEKRD